MADSNNYRAITLSNIIGKVLNWVVLLKKGVTLVSSDLLFALKQSDSVTNCECIIVILETSITIVIIGVMFCLEINFK